MRKHTPVLTPELLNRISGALSLLVFGGVLSAFAWTLLWLQGSGPGFLGLIASVLCAVGAGKVRNVCAEMAGEEGPQEMAVAHAAPEPEVRQVVPERVEPKPKRFVEDIDGEKVEVREPKPKETRKEEFNSFHTAKPSWSDSIDWEQWVGKKLLQKAGILIVLIGMIVLLKYSFDNRWIGELGRIALGVLAAALMLGAGEWYSRKYANWAHAFTGGGLVMLYFTVWVAHVFYAKQLLATHGLVVPPVVALVLYALITAVGCIAAVRYRAQVIAWFAVIGGYLTPFLISGPSRPELLCAYLAILSLGLLGLAWKQRWKYLNLAAFVLTQMYLAGMVYTASSISDGEQIAVAVCFFLLFNLLPLAYQFGSRIKAQGDDVLLLVLNGLAVFLPVTEAMGGIAGEYTSFACLALAAVYLAFGAAALHRCRDDGSLINAYLVGGIVLIALAMLQEMRTPDYSYVAAGWAPLSVLLAFVSVRLRRSGPWVCAQILLAGSMVILVTNLPGFGFHAEQVWYPFTSRFALQSYVVFASLLAWIKAASMQPKELLDEASRPALLGTIHALTAMVLFTFVSFEAFALEFTPDLTLTFSYLLFAVVALTAYFVSRNVVWFAASVIAHVLVLLFTFVAGDGSGMALSQRGSVVPFVHPWAAIALCALLFTACLFYASQRGPDDRLKAPEMRGILIASLLAQLWLHLTVEIMHMDTYFGWSDLVTHRVMTGWWAVFAAGLLAWGVRRGSQTYVTAGIALLALPFIKDLGLMFDGRAGFYETVLWTLLSLGLSVAGAYAKRREMVVSGVIMLCVTAAVDMAMSIDAAVAAGLLRSVWWAIAALGAIIAGFAAKEKLLRSTGILVFGAVAFKLLIIDFSGLTPGVRIGASIATGLLMIGASYLYQRSSDVVTKR